MKAQVSLELVIVSVALLSMFLGILYIIDYRDDDVALVSRYLDAKDEADVLARHINEVYISGFGSRREIYLSNETSDGTALSLFVQPESRQIKVQWDERFYIAPLVTSRITSNISGNTSSNSTLVEGKMTITNVRGEIRLVQ